MRVIPSSRPRSYGAAALQCGIAALCFSLGAMLNGVGRGIENGNGGIGLMLRFRRPRMATNSSIAWNNQTWLANRMRDDHIHHRWEARKDASGALVVGEFAACLGWFFAIPPASYLAQILDDGGTRSASGTIIYAFVAASVLTIVEFTSRAGTAQTAEWMASSWPLLTEASKNDEGELTAAQAFEMSYFMIQSRTLWLFAMDDVLIAFGVGSAAFLIYTSSQVSNVLGHLGVAVVLMCILDFAFEVSRFVDWRVSSNAVIVTSLLLDAILLPAWLLGVGFTLRKISLSGGAYAPSVEGGGDAATAHVEMQESGNATGAIKASGDVA